jgi:hypothetical protein
VYGPDKEFICGDFFWLTTKASYFKSSLKYVLIIFNKILTFVVIYAVMWIGYRTETAQLERITMVTFLCQFFNTGFILMLVNADCSEQPILGLFVNSGSYADFNSDFFKTIGSTVVATMLFNAYFPVLYFGL